MSRKQPVIGVRVQPGGPGPLNSKISLMRILLTVANFFQKFLLHKNWPGGGELLLQNVQ